jgi:hypothetical protein
VPSRLFSKNGHADPLIRMLAGGQRYTRSIDWMTLSGVRAMLEASNTFTEDEGVKQKAF